MVIMEVYLQNLPNRGCSRLSVDKEKVVLMYSFNLTESIEFRDAHTRHA